MMPKTKEFFFEHRLTKKIKLRFVQCNKKNQSIIIHLHNI